MIQVAPSILSADFARLGEQIEEIEAAGADLVHIDVMDGHFVPNLSLGLPVIRSIRKWTQLPFDVHLMISQPDSYLDAFCDAGADLLTVHWEACPHLHRTIQSIRKRGVRAGVALNPATPICVLDSILEDVDMVLLMTVNPGFGGQSYISSVTEKIRILRKMCQGRGLADMWIEVDGGIDEKTAPLVVEAGANVLVAGSAVFGATDKKQMMARLRQG